MGDRWLRAGAGSRAFLPRSADGRWAWYRLATKPLQAVNFWREGTGSALDQPPLLRWARARGGRGFLAVLGHPVEHSRTPAIQEEFAREHGLDAFAIDVRPEEWDEGALEFLRTLGLRFAAVTAPLKERAFAVSARADAVAARARAANCLAWSGEWICANTDLDGLRAAWADAVKDLDPALQTGERAAIWGGGGTRAIAGEVLPNAREYSARTGRPRGDALADDSTAWSPEVVLWAVGRSRMRDGSLPCPPAGWAPRLVVDLNYSEDSPGRDYAEQTKSDYISGLAMFREQAKRQREFWRQNGG